MANHEDEKRFDNEFGDDYQVFEKVYDHYWPLQQSIIGAIKRYFHPAEKISALEVGLGPGETAATFLSSFVRAKVTAVDESGQMLAQARHNLSTKNLLGQISFVFEDALEYVSSLKDNSTDLFYSGYTLHNFQSRYRSEFLRELYRVIRPGGVFVNADKYALDDLDERCQAFNWSMAQYPLVLGPIGQHRLCREWLLHMAEDENPDRIMIESEAIEEMKRIGFLNMQIVFRVKMEATLVATVPDLPK